MGDNPRALPEGVFLICGDRAWQGVPGRAIGGPCYLGRLTILAPTHLQWENIIRTAHSQRRRRSIGLPPDCNDNVNLLSTAARVALAMFVPGANRVPGQVEMHCENSHTLLVGLKSKLI